MLAHSSLKVSDSHDKLKSSIVNDGFWALSLKHDATRSIITTLDIHIHIPRLHLQHARTITESIKDLIQGGYWVRCQLYTGIGFIPRELLFMKLQVWRECWQSQISMADSSTTTTPILDLIAGGFWARNQLRGGIGYVSVTSIPMK